MAIGFWRRVQSGCLKRGGWPPLLLFMAAAFMWMLPGLALRAHNSCDWHAANDTEPDFLHYDTAHDSDGDGIGCEQITGLPPDSGAEATTVVFAEVVAVGERVDPTEDEQAALDAEDEGDAGPSVALATLLVNSNFRRGPGLGYYIVGGGAAGSAYQWVQAQYGSGGYIWYQLSLPNGEGWVRGDLVEARSAEGEIVP